VFSRTRLVDRLLTGILALLFLLSLAPISLSLVRKISRVGRADVLVSRETEGLLVRFVAAPQPPPGSGPATSSSSWTAGRPWRRATRRSGWPAAPRTSPFSGAASFDRSGPCPSRPVGRPVSDPARGRRRVPRHGRERASDLGKVPGRRRVPSLRRSRPLRRARPRIDAEPPRRRPVPVHGPPRGRARAIFPGLLLLLVLTFPRRGSALLRLAALLPAAALLAATGSVYLGGAPGRDAGAAVAELDRLQVVWIAAAVSLAIVRLVRLWLRPGDLLAEKQVRYLLLGTAVGLLPVVALNLVPGLFGLSIPVLSALSIIPLVLVPFAFLAALTRFRLWDAEVFGRESAALVGAGLAGAALFAGAQVLFSRLNVPNVPYARGTLEVAAGLVLALSFVPVRRGLSAAFARLQYGEAWSARGELLALVRELAAPRIAPEIAEILVSRTMRGLGVAPAALLPVLADGRLPADEVDGGPPLSLSGLPGEASRRTTRLSRRSFEEAPTEEVGRLRAAGFRTLSPLAASGRLLAFFAFGDRHGRVPPSQEDLELLETVLAPAALALDMPASTTRSAPRPRATGP